MQRCLREGRQLIIEGMYLRADQWNRDDLLREASIGAFDEMTPAPLVLHFVLSLGEDDHAQLVSGKVRGREAASGRSSSLRDFKTLVRNYRAIQEYLLSVVGSRSKDGRRGISAVEIAVDLHSYTNTLELLHTDVLDAIKTTVPPDAIKRTMPPTSN